MLATVYYPYLRGKQFELSALRELAMVLAEGNVVPIIEPVRKRINSLERTLTVLNKAESKNILILNPQVGEFAKNHAALHAVLQDAGLLNLKHTKIGVIIASEEDITLANGLLKQYKEGAFLIIERPRLDGLPDFINANLKRISGLICDEAKIRTLLRTTAAKKDLIIIREDGFQREERNADYNGVSEFSEVHLIWREEGYAGFSDYLIIGNTYSESGGPAYTVAIHLTRRTGHQEELEIRHFISDSNETYVDTAGKFREAMAKLGAFDANHALYNSSALDEYRSLVASGHFPGLGYIKKLSIKHHIELLNEWLKTEGRE